MDATEERVDDEVGAGRSSFLRLMVALRSIGRSASPTTMAELRSSFPWIEAKVDRIATLLPRFVGQMLRDLLKEGSRLRMSVWDPRSLREAASAVERFLEEAPADAMIAVGRIPEDRFPIRGISRVGLFLLGTKLRGVDAVRHAAGGAVVGDAVLTEDDLDRTVAALDRWHPAYGLAASRQPGTSEGHPRRVPGPAASLQPDRFGSTPSTVDQFPTALLLPPAQTDRLGEVVRFDDEGLSDEARHRFRQVVAVALFLLLRLFVKSYAGRVQRSVVFRPLPPGEGSSFVRPNEVRVAPDADPWAVVRCCWRAVDALLATDPASPSRSSEPGPLRAVGEAVGTAEDPSVSLADLVVAYLGMLVVQQHVLEAIPPSSVDRSTVVRTAAVFLDALLDEQKRVLDGERSNRLPALVERTVTAGAGAVGLGSVAWFFPQR